MKLISQGAEAKIYSDSDRIVKIRERKSYRLDALDTRLRNKRTRKEAKILASLPVPGPKLISSDEKSATIVMERLKGDKLKDVLERADCRKLMLQVGKHVALLHDKGVIHGDLTTSNMIVREGIVHIIDYGLSFNSQKVEDKAVDLHLLRQALMSRHHEIADACFNSFLEGYGARKDAVARLSVVEKRGRNKH
jgi:Kae1-associated kinase Bud32